MVDGEREDNDWPIARSYAGVIKDSFETSGSEFQRNWPADTGYTV